jgi:hypothetical protein
LGSVASQLIQGMDTAAADTVSDATAAEVADDDADDE